MEVNKIESLLKYLYNLNPISGEYCYRGQANSEWVLRPSIHRKRLERYQTVFVEAFLLYLLENRSIRKTHIYTNHPIEFLAMCQHYGIDTRLLDWSNDILISLFFACEEKNNKDGALFVCNKNYYSKFDFAKFRETVKEPLLIDTNLVNPRMRSQSGSFMIWGAEPLNSDTTETYTLEEYNDSIFDDNPIEKLIIPKERKEYLLNELNEKYSIHHNSVYLNNAFSRKIEQEYEIFKKISTAIAKELTRSPGEPKLLNLTTNFAGCKNIRSLPEKPPSDFNQFVQQIVGVISNKVGRNEPCICGSGKKYKKCCG